MANRFAIANGNFNDTATWSTTSTGSGGASVPVAGDNAIANNRTVTITANATCDNVTNGSTYGGTNGGGFIINDGVTLTANVIGGSASASKCVTYNGTTSASINGDVTGGTGNFANPNQTVGVYHNGTGTLTVTGADHAGGTGQYATAFLTNSTGVLTISGNINPAAGSANGRTIMHGNGTINITGNITGATSSTSRTISGTSAVDFNAILNITGNVTAGSSTPALSVGSSGILTCVGNFTATNATAAIESTTATATLKLSGSFISAADGTLPVYARKFIMNSAPLLAFTRYSLDGAGDYVDMFTADNSLGQANPSDVRSGVSYASGNLTGSLTVPVRGTVSYGVEYGPSMPFTATRSGTTATATMAYSYPYQVGDFISVTGASNSEWNGDYTIASVISSTEVTFSVPSTHSATADTGALAQTKGTAVLDASAVATAVWSAAARTITGGTVDTLTNAPASVTPADIWSYNDRQLTTASGPTAVQIRQEMDSNSTKLANLDASVSSRLASADYTTPPTTAQISAAVEGSLLDENDGQAVLNALVGAIGNQNVDEIALVAAIRSDLERAGGKLDSIPTDAAPSAASVASAVWSASTKEITGGTVDTLTNAPASVTPADIWDYNARTLTSASGPTAVEIRQEIDANSTKLDVAISTRLAAADYVEPANSDVAAIKAKTDALPSDPADQSLLEAAIAGVTAPSAATVATAVRSELSSELSKVSALNTERLNNCATTSIVGNLIAQANS